MKNLFSNFRKNSTGNDSSNKYKTNDNNSNNNNGNGNYNNHNSNNHSSNDSIGNQPQPNFSQVPKRFSSNLASFTSSWSDPNRLEMVREEEIVLDMYNNSTNNGIPLFFSNNGNNNTDNNTDNGLNSKLSLTSNYGIASKNGFNSNKDDNIIDNNRFVSTNNNNNDNDKSLKNNPKSSAFFSTPKPFSSITNTFSSVNSKNNKIQFVTESNQNIDNKSGAEASRNLPIQSSLKKNENENGNGNENGIVHLSTRIITDDVPPRNYGLQDLRSESTISLVNTSTLPVKKGQSLVQPITGQSSVQPISSTSNSIATIKTTSQSASIPIETTTNLTKTKTTTISTSVIRPTASPSTISNQFLVADSNANNDNRNAVDYNLIKSTSSVSDPNIEYELGQTSFINSISQSNNFKKYVAPLPPSSLTTKTINTMTSTISSTNDLRPTTTQLDSVNSDNLMSTTTKTVPRFDISAFERGKLPVISENFKNMTSFKGATPITTTAATTTTTSVSTTTTITSLHSTLSITSTAKTLQNVATPKTSTKTTAIMATSTTTTSFQTPISTPTVSKQDNYSNIGLPVFFNNNVDFTTPQNFKREDLINNYQPGFSTGFRIGLPTFIKNPELSPNRENNFQINYTKTTTSNTMLESPSLNVPGSVINENLKQTGLDQNEKNQKLDSPGNSSRYSSTRNLLIRPYSSKNSPNVNDSKIQPTNFLDNSKNVAKNEIGNSTKVQAKNDISNNISKVNTPTKDDINGGALTKSPANNFKESKSESIKNELGNRVYLNVLDENSDGSMQTTAIDDVSLESDITMPQNNNKASKPISKLSIPPIFNNTYNSNLNKKSLVNIPQNSFIRDKKFINHLETVIAKSATSSLNIKTNTQKPNQTSGTDKPKFKFLVEGIDIPDGSSTNKLPELPEISPDDDISSNKIKKEPKGFSYIKDKKLAEQVTRLAAEVTARKPHESIEHLNSEKEIVTHGENDFMKEARRKLHAHLNGLKKFDSNEGLDKRLSQDNQKFNNNFSKSVPDITSTNLDDSFDGNGATNFIRDTDETDNFFKGKKDHGSKRHHTESNINFNKLNNSDKNYWGSVVSTDSHNIPHDTSRIFLRPHNNDLEQLKKLEIERNRSLKKKTSDPLKTTEIDFKEHFVDPKSKQNNKTGTSEIGNKIISKKYLEGNVNEEFNNYFMSSSSEQSKEEQSVSSGRYRKSKNSSTPSLKQSKIKQKAKMYNNNGNSPNNNNNNNNNNSYKGIAYNNHQTDDRYSLHNKTTYIDTDDDNQHASKRPFHQANYNYPGMISPVLQAGTRTDSMQRLSNTVDDAYIHREPYDEVVLKQKKTNTRGGIKDSKSYSSGNNRLNNVNNNLNTYDTSSDNSDEVIYYSDTTRREQFKQRNNFKNPSHRYGSESNLTRLTKSKFTTTPGNVTVGIENGNKTKVNAFQVKSRETPIKGLITVDKLKKPNSTSLTSIPNVVSGELTLVKKDKKQENKRDRSRTLTSSGITIGGPSVYLKNFDDGKNANGLLKHSNYFKNSISLHDISTANQNFSQNLYKKTISEPFQTTTLNRFSTKKTSRRVKNMQGYDTITRSLPTLETTSVDPELERVGKLGNQYRIQLKLNAAMAEKHLTGRQSRLTNTSYHDSSQEKFRPASGPMYSSNFVEYDDGMIQAANNLSLNYGTPLPPVSSYHHSPSYYRNNQVNSLLSLQISPQQNVLTTVNQNVDEGDNYAIKSITASKPMQKNHPTSSKVEFQLELLPTSEPIIETYSMPSTYPLETSTIRKAKPTKTRISQDELDYNMTLNDTMRLEYEPPTKIIDNEFETTTRSRISPTLTDIGRNYTNPVNQFDEVDSSSFPKIVRGSILIRNSLDRETGRRYLNALNNDKNKSKNNLFHGKYHQRRENPVYSSDFENLEEYSRHNKRLISQNYNDTSNRDISSIPTIAQEWDETDYRNVPINREWYHEYLTGSKTKSENTNRRSGAWKLKSARTKEIPIDNGAYTFNNGGASSSYYTNSKYDWENGAYGPEINYNNIRQSVDVEREEEQVIGPVTPESKTDVETALNVDAVSEKVELSLSDGIVTIEVKVRCERLVPIRGTTDMFRKSAVVVTRKIEIDMMVTPERRSMYEAAVSLSQQQGFEEKGRNGSKCLRLSTKDTFELYCKLMEMADKLDGPEEGMLFGSVHIDKELEEDKRLPYGATSAEVLISDDNLLSPGNSLYHRARTRLS